MCLCHQCAEVLRYQSNKCPICRGPVRSLLKIEISTGASKDSFTEKVTVEKEQKDVEEVVDTQLLKKSKKKSSKTSTPKTTNNEEA